MNRKQRRGTTKFGDTSNRLPGGTGAVIPTSASGILSAGIDYHRAGRLAEAEVWYRRVLAAEPNHPDATHLLGIIAHQFGRHELAVEFIERAIRNNGHPAYFFSLGNVLYSQGKLDDAVAAYRQAISVKPDYVEAYSNLGNALKDRGSLDGAVVAYCRAISIKPDYAEAYSNLGAALYEQGRLDQAVAAYRQAIRIKPDYAEALLNLGAALRIRGTFDEAVAAYRQAISVKPDYAEAYSNLGNALKDRGSLDEAAAAYRQAIRIKPDYAEAYSNLGAALYEQGRLDQAVAAYRQAIRIKPDYAEAYSNLGNALKERGTLDEAVAAHRQAIRIKPEFAGAYSNLGTALNDQGKLEEAIASYRQAIRIKPDFAEAYSNLMMCLHYSSSVANTDLHTEALAFERQFDTKVGNLPHNNVRDSHRRLRIGYVSADFKHHPVGYFLSSVLSAHDPAVTEIYCYSNQVTDDDMSVRLRACADQWRCISRMTDTDVAALIHRDAIDILVDLSGHTAGNRLTMFALRPAPVQVSWLGYFGTTGLSSIDYILADRFIVPEGEQKYFTEAVWRLPGCYLCYTPYDLDVRVGLPRS